MARKSWKDLSPTARGSIVAAAAVDAGLRAWAGADLASRRGEEVNGPKWLWGTGLALVNSAGVLPVVYLVVGRRKAVSSH
ncbi:hypothetical protein HH308_02735 [Gordonia sp. TBRC 11910]|uniref:DUF5652 domain-containing protein n=1 Tax=Gordonia asplenii TaxID=2725283 RepID=A0A848KXE1_9ACTN|nr:DUF5652 family protein [Gordonia asplenii]NMO00128.1 hypothetical protein [Gordonia asplenii]